MRVSVLCTVLAALLPSRAGAQSFPPTESEGLAHLSSNSLTVRATRAAIEVARADLLAQREAAGDVRLSLRDAIETALQSRASLKAEAERTDAAEGRTRQAGAWPNPEFQFSNENLRPGETYGRDVDIKAYVTQPLDVLGKRQQRVKVAEQGVARTQAEYDHTRWYIIREVALAYWAARGARERRDVLQATVDNFQRTIDYQTARLSVGAIAEQDVLRVRLEGERLQIAMHLATIDASKARTELLKVIGQPTWTHVVLTEPLDVVPTGLPHMSLEEVFAARPELRVARAALAEARANERLQVVSARPDIGVFFGYKRTELPDALSGVNTALAGVTMTLPLTDRKQGDRQTAAAEVRRQEQVVAAAENDVRADLEQARQEYEMRRTEVTDTLQPLRDHASAISQIAEAAYAQDGIDVLRLLSTEPRDA
jgi:cobalt-zinc-cadmium efflux system outer membrane protein